ncbi:hypothetical protein C8R46DRAFT_1356323 [Mycena filopes]|nr:hypothetical protein C8R46DRAFT_1356323 [Mycena filopes]
MSIQLFSSPKRQRSPSLASEQPPAKRHASSGGCGRLEQLQSQLTQLVSPKRRRSHCLSLEEPPAKRHAGSKILDQLQRAPDVVAKTTIQDLPLELLELILELVVPPAEWRPRLEPKGFFLLDDGKPNPNRPWEKTMTAKKTLVLVCRDWCALRRPSLYRDITVVSTRSLDALWWTRRRNESLGRLVRSLTFNFTAEPETTFGPPETSGRDMGDIVSLCPGLTQLNLFQSNYHHPFNAHQELVQIPSTVTSLGLGDRLNVAQLVSALDSESTPGICDRLLELHLPLWRIPPTEKPLSFPNLHTLHLTCTGAYEADLAEDPDAPIPTATWLLPQLRRLIFRTRSTQMRDPFREYFHFLQRHGHRIEYLEFPDWLAEHWAYTNYEALLKLCPVLRHVVLPVPARASVISGRTFPTVRRVDVWCSRAHAADADDADAAIAALVADRTPFPNLETMPRMLDPALAEVILDLPRAFDARDAGFFAWPGLVVLQRERDGLAQVLLPNEKEIAEAGGIGVRWGTWTGFGEEEDEEDEVVVELVDPQPEEGASVEQSILGPAVRQFFRTAMPRSVFLRLGRDWLGL